MPVTSPISTEPLANRRQASIYKVHSTAPLPIQCTACALARSCLSAGLDAAELETIDAIIRRVRPLRQGAYLFEAGSPLETIYVLRSGSVKTFLPTTTGGEQVTGFHLPGDLLGLHAIADLHYGSSARTLETSSFCLIPYRQLEEITHRVPRIQQQLLRTMSRKLSYHQGLMLMLGKQTAEARLAGLLVNLSERYARLGLSATELHLSMSRNDIGNYLGLATETVSRQLRRFQDQGLVEVRNKDLRLLDPEGLRTRADSA